LLLPLILVREGRLDEPVLTAAPTSSVTASNTSIGCLRSARKARGSRGCGSS
jgi:hypothetical protein